MFVYCVWVSILCLGHGSRYRSKPFGFGCFVSVSFRGDPKWPQSTRYCPQKSPENQQKIAKIKLKKPEFNKKNCKNVEKSYFTCHGDAPSLAAALRKSSRSRRRHLLQEKNSFRSRRKSSASSPSKNSRHSPAKNSSES